MQKIKLNKLDIVFSQLVRERANWTCERCGRYFPEYSRRGIHCSHFYGRRAKSVRWHPLNAAAHCAGCHKYLESNPIEFQEWIQNHLGSHYNTLIDLKNNTLKLNDTQKNDMLIFFKKELDRMKNLRYEGKIGRIEFASFQDS